MTGPQITIDLSAAEPPYEQVRAQIAGAVATGALAAGDRLPTVRALAADLGLAVNTVARAYKELEADGLVVTRRRAGTVVAPGTRASDAAISRAAAAFARHVHAAGMPEHAAIDLVRAALRSAES